MSARKSVFPVDKMPSLEKLHAKCHEDGDCLIWEGCIDINGIPRLTVKVAKDYGKTLQVRRAVWIHKYGPIPEGKRVSVSCGNSLCLEHLELTTPGEVISRTAKKPDVRAKRRASGLMTRERSKLDMEKAEYIRNTNKTGAEVARELGIGESTASRIRRGLSWVDLSNPFARLMS